MFGSSMVCGLVQVGVFVFILGRNIEKLVWVVVNLVVDGFVVEVIQCDVFDEVLVD